MTSSNTREFQQKMLKPSSHSIVHIFISRHGCGCCCLREERLSVVVVVLLVAASPGAEAPQRHLPAEGVPLARRPQGVAPVRLRGARPVGEHEDHRNTPHTER